MKDIQWIAESPLKSAALLQALEKAGKFTIPEDLRDLLTEHNGGSPLLGEISIPDEVRFSTDLKCLLSYNPEDEETVYRYIKWFIQKHHATLIPFALDSFSHFYCFRLKSYYYYDPSDDRLIFLADNLEDFFRLFKQY